MALSTWVIKVIISAVVLILALFLYPLAISLLGNKIPSGKIGKHQTQLVKRMVKLILWGVLIIVLIIIWGFDLENVWVMITGAIALVAIGFFAVWSILSNILAGILIFLTKPFKVGDKIQIISDEISGEVEAVKTIFTVLKDQKGNTISVPNNMLFQKVIKTFK